MSDWNGLRQQVNGPDSRRKVALVAGAIIIAFILLFVIIVNVANSTGHKKLSAATAATTTTAAPDGSVSGDGNATTTLTDPPDPSTADGEVAQPDQLARSYAESTSDLSPADWTKATTIAAQFVTADATGQGVSQFGYYYATKAINTPWIKDFNIEWVYATSEVQGSIHAMVWYTGTSLVDGSTVQQAIQDVWLDTAKDDQVIHPIDLINYGVNVNLNSCCVSIQN